MTEVLTSPLANHLDDAGVKDWRRRLREARDQDDRRRDGTGVAYEKAWDAVRAEYRRALVVRAVPDADTASLEENGQE